MITTGLLMASDQDLLHNAERLKRICRARGTGNQPDPLEYSECRGELLSDKRIEGVVPKFVTQCQNLDEFWEECKEHYDKWDDRREWIRSEFEPLITFIKELASHVQVPIDTEGISVFGSDRIKDTYQKAYDRIENEPEGAITMARSLLESTCKHILSIKRQSCDKPEGLPKMYGRTLEALSVAPSDAQSDAFKKLLGGCSTIVNSIGQIRNDLSDAHGQGPDWVPAAQRHARLIVNASATVSSFLLDTLQVEQHKF